MTGFGGTCAVPVLVLFWQTPYLTWAEMGEKGSDVPFLFPALKGRLQVVLRPSCRRVKKGGWLDCLIIKHGMRCCIRT